MLKLKKKAMTEVGFIDPNRVFKDIVTPYEMATSSGEASVQVLR